MDRERLKEVHQSDLSEQRINEEFVDWLKTKGWTWLVVVLAAVAAYMMVVNYKQGQIVKRSEAWRAYYGSDQPSSLEDVAREFDGVDGVGRLALLKAADRYLDAIQSGRPISDTAETPVGGLLSAEDRTSYIARAESLYQQVIDGDDGSTGATLVIVNAMNGHAALAEARSDTDGARQWYDRAAERAEAVYPGLSELSTARAANVGPMGEDVTFRGQGEINAVEGIAPPRTPVEMDAGLRTLIYPEEATDDASGDPGTP